MKKITLVFILLFLFLFIPANAVELNNNLQIRILLRDYDKALKKQDIDKIKDFYTENYRDSDGFTLEESIQMFEKMYNAYDKVKQKTKINSITSFDNYIIVQLTDTTNALVSPQKELFDKNKKKSIRQTIREKRIIKERQGKLESTSIYSLYFKKIDGKWKIFYDDITAETTSLKYGVAKNVDMQLTAPAFTKEGENYDLSLKIGEKSDDLFAVASLNNEEILFPAPEYKEKYRKLSSQGNLERVVKANNNKKNECAVASIGFTQVSLNEAQTKARIEMVGMALLMKRVNIINSKDKNEK